MKLSIHNVSFPKVFSQFDKPLHFQDISHIEELINFAAERFLLSLPLGGVPR